MLLIAHLDIFPPFSLMYSRVQKSFRLNARATPRDRGLLGTTIVPLGLEADVDSSAKNTSMIVFI